METLIGLIALTIPLALLGALAWFIFRVFVPAKGKPMVCTHCGHLGPAQQVTKGSAGIELVLWLLFLLPGLIYSLWRLSTRTVGCEECGATALVPPTSPVGRRMVREAQEQPQAVARTRP
jgi:hypothetical protein